MSYISDWKCGAISDEEYERCGNVENRIEKSFLAEIERQIYDERKDE